MEEKKNQIVILADKLLNQEQQEKRQSVVDITHLAGDGSQRVFYRLQLSNAATIVGVLPNEDSPLGLKEAVSAWQICCHLHRRGIAVPEPVAFDEKSGLILFEDLGDIRLHDLLEQPESLKGDYQFTIYRKVIRELVRMQFKGREGFDTSWCWQTPHYDRQLMLERESSYFLQALCKDFFNLDLDVDSLNQEFVRIAGKAAQAPAQHFLHRDFQSRNIMVDGDAVRIIDFQGGRLGPLGYDLASLLIDPYVSLSTELKESLFDEYVCELLKRMKYDPKVFREEYNYLAMQRNLQILGAFAFLGKQRGKPFFLTFIQPALESMLDLLGKVTTDHYPVLIGVIETCLEKIVERNT